MTVPRASRRQILSLALCVALLSSVSARTETLLAAEMPPPEAREFRAAWVATVANIDWPSAPNLSTDQQRSEALAIIERAKTMGLNALVLQVRPAGDSMYPSALEPWSEYLTGAPGKAPNPAWDPLAFWVQESHRRGMELHAWFNPYRARPVPPKSGPLATQQPLVAPHLAVLRPELAKPYGDMLWFDPGEPDAAKHTLAVVADVVRRYDIDAVHIDDYFYPYPVAVDGVDTPFPDDESYARYRLSGGALPRDDWRRANVNTLVQQLQQTVRSIKPWVRVGISPFGVGRPDRRPAGVVGFSQYDKLYADVELWFENGWLDYLAPQLYWQIERAGLQFPVLMDYWVAQNKAGRHVWPGLFTSLITKGEPGTVLGNRNWLAREVLDQVQLMRQRVPHQSAAAGASGAPDATLVTTPTVPTVAATPASTTATSSTTATTPAPVSTVDAKPTPALPFSTAVDHNPGVSGHIHFSMVALMQNRDGIATLLQFGPYKDAALVPATPWLEGKAPGAPLLRLSTTAPGARLTLKPAPGETTQAYAVWLRSGGQWRLQVVGVQAEPVDAQGADAAVASAIGRTGLLGPRVSLRLAAVTLLRP